MKPLNSLIQAGSAIGLASVLGFAAVGQLRSVLSAAALNRCITQQSAMGRTLAEAELDCVPRELRLD